MESFRVRLEACDPARGLFRGYRIDAGTDLLGDWLVDVTYGRIGSRGRIVRYLAGDEADARKIVSRCLQRRASAPKRIGVACRLSELDDPSQWAAASDGIGSGFVAGRPDHTSSEPSSMLAMTPPLGKPGRSW